MPDLETRGEEKRGTRSCSVLELACAASRSRICVRANIGCKSDQERHRHSLYSRSLETLHNLHIIFTRSKSPPSSGQFLCGAKDQGLPKGHGFLRSFRLFRVLPSLLPAGKRLSCTRPAVPAMPPIYSYQMLTAVLSIFLHFRS